MKIIKTLLLIILFLLISCKGNFSEKTNQKDTYAIITLLYKKIAEPIEPIFPPKPYDKTFSKLDSIRIQKIILQRKKEINGEKFIVAVVPNFQVDYLDFKLPLSCELKAEFFPKTRDLNLQKQIDLSKITKKKNDSLIYFREELLDSYSKEFTTFDFLISLSPIIFNKKSNKAMVVFSGARSKIDGVSTLYFLEKVNREWRIVCEYGISTS